MRLAGTVRLLAARQPWMVKRFLVSALGLGALALVGGPLWAQHGAHQPQHQHEHHGHGPHRGGGHSEPAPQEAPPTDQSQPPAHQDGHAPPGESGTITPMPPAGPAKPAAVVPRRVAMEELHRLGGVPRGWTFTLPAGDAERGRKVFADLECYKCHTIRGESFPPSGGEPGRVGPELTGMGDHHPPEYFAESILAPNHVIVEGPGFTGPDGLSIMPSYADSLSVSQWLDLVAFLGSQTSGGHHGHDDHTGPGPRAQVIGDYRVQLVYHDGRRDTAAHGGSDSASGHLMVFVTDRDSGAPVPYLPLTATVSATGKRSRSIRLAPVLGPEGFHYGADVTLPEGVERITVGIGAATIPTPGDPPRYKQPVTVVFELEPRAR